MKDRTPWEKLVEKVRQGPPLLLRPFDGPMNTVEFFIHVEDVRRAQEGWEPARSLRSSPMPFGRVSGRAGWRRKSPPRSSSPHRGEPTKKAVPGRASLWPASRASSPCSAPAAKGQPTSRSRVTRSSPPSCVSRRWGSDLRSLGRRGLHSRLESNWRQHQTRRSSSKGPAPSVRLRTLSFICRPGVVTFTSAGADAATTSVRRPWRP